ncbi:MAG: ABC transporter ATP-binding protein [Verrucomicrobiales bacterium]|nr:ABC transporter ATP-binding protein [Verrucomicrobiales bacterium]|tara:strand:+ start:8618 stop:10540 length:1923 start_codon:yes stop_codon:yes gene_type:complete
MLTVAGVDKSYGGRTLFKDATLQINRRDRFGLVGPNGAGKSTFFRILLQEESPDVGEVSFERGVTFGYLPQESAPVGDETVIELATAITEEFRDLRRRLLAWDSAHPGEIDLHDDVHTQYNELGGYQLEAKAKKILKGLAFRDSDFDRPASELSGGWVMRAHLARLLVLEPDLLLLDEPTNHLDLYSLLWFQDYLRTYPGAILMISHDREFLNQLVSSVVEIRFSKLIKYRGNYDAYLEQREANEAQHLAAYKNQQREIDRLMTFVDRFRAKNTKASQAQSKLKQIEKMEIIDAPESDAVSIDFHFPQPARSGLKSITLKNIRQAYGNNVVYDGMEFEAERGQRIVLVGPNGAGKSTLLKLLAEVIAPQSGERILGHNVRFGYFSQYRAEILDLSRSVLDEALDTPQRVSEQFVRSILGCFLFRGDDVFKKIAVLSGGEKSRLALVKLLLNPPNLLLMDEPTTHLDMASIEALAAALDQYEGTLIFISHDVYFIRALANHVVHVEDGRLRHYPGDYDYYVDKTDNQSANSPASPGGPANKGAEKQNNGLSRKDQKRIEAEARQAKSKIKKQHKAAVERIEGKITRLEERQAELITLLEDPEIYSRGGEAAQCNRELMQVQDDLQSLNREWEAAAEALEKI